MKRISPGTVTVGVFAVVFGLVAAFVVKQSYHDDPVIKKKKLKTVPVVVARVNLDKHERIRISDLDIINVPATQKIPKGVLRRSQVAAGRVTRNTIQAGQAINEAQLYGIGESHPGIAEQLPKGFRAFTLQLKQESARGISDESKVDIAMSVEGDHPDLGELATRTLLRNVKVIGVRTKRGNSSVSLTLAVTPKNANTLITAQQTGDLSVTLCGNHDEDSPTEDDSITRKQLLGLREIPEPQEVVQPQPYTIEKWEGGQLKKIQLAETHLHEASQVAAAEEAKDPKNNVAAPTVTTPVLSND